MCLKFTVNFRLLFNRHDALLSTEMHLFFFSLLSLYRLCFQSNTQNVHSILHRKIPRSFYQFFKFIYVQILINIKKHFNVFFEYCLFYNLNQRKGNNLREIQMQMLAYYGTYFITWFGKYTIQMNNNLKKLDSDRLPTFCHIGPSIGWVWMQIIRWKISSGKRRKWENIHSIYYQNYKTLIRFINFIYRCCFKLDWNP